LFAILILPLACCIPRQSHLPSRK